MPNEASSKINYRYEYDKASTAYGQASAITPIQQIEAATAIANGGTMMKPYVIDHITDPNTNKTILQHEPTVAGKPISSDTAKQVRDILGEVVSSKIEQASLTKSKDLTLLGKQEQDKLAVPAVISKEETITSFHLWEWRQKMIRSCSFM